MQKDNALSQYKKWNARLLRIYWYLYAVLVVVTALLFAAHRLSGDRSTVQIDALNYFLFPVVGNFFLLLFSNFVYAKFVINWKPFAQACYIMSVLILLCSVLVGVNYFNSAFSCAYSGPIMLSILYMDKNVLRYTSIASVAACGITYAIFVLPVEGATLVSSFSLYAVLSTLGVLGAGYLVAALILQRIRETVETAQAFSLEAARLNRELARDPFTKLYNHAAFYDQLDKRIQFACKTGEAFSLIIMDIDNFKCINDQYGHDVGDIVLLRLVGIINAQVKRGDAAFRYGGEEFIVLSTGAKDRALALAERIRARFAAYAFAELSGKHVTVSLGVCEYDRTFGGRREFFSAADKALYRAKQQGKNAVVLAE